jgi:hypothetical protein
LRAGYRIDILIKATAGTEQMPPLPTLRSFFSELLRSLECPVIIGSRISELEHDAMRQLKKAEAQFVNAPAPFAQLLSQYANPNPEHRDADVRRAQWEFIAKALHVRGHLPGNER